MIFHPFEKRIITLRIALLMLSFGLCLSGERQEVFKTPQANKLNQIILDFLR